VLDISSEGLKKWENANNMYDIKIDRVEGYITNQLRDKLAAAGNNANQLFRIFSKFNALFSRPRIRGAIQEY
jgi:dynein heavy chain 1